MKQTVNFYDFERAFADYNRKENFSYAGLKALFEYFESYEEDTGEEIELDVIAICCDFNEYSLDEYVNDYGVDIDENLNDDERRQAILEYASDHTTVIEVDDDTIIIQAY